MANYITTLKGQVADRDEAIAEAQDTIQHLLQYLASPKFHEDTTVQSGEIITKLVEIRSSLTVEG